MAETADETAFYPAVVCSHPSAFRDGRISPAADSADAVVGGEVMDIKELKNISVPYDSPIEVCLGNTIETMSSAVAEWFDDGVVKAVTNVGYSIDKQKLVRILERDRQRYEEAYRIGYSAGYAKRDEEIVRCKDCKHRPTQKKCFPDTACPCQCSDSYYSWVPPDDWYCADGEPKDGDVE